VTDSQIALDSIAQWDEGRSSERCRRATFLMLFNPQGRPQGLLWLLAGLCALVIALALGQAG